MTNKHITGDIITVSPVFFLDMKTNYFFFVLVLSGASFFCNSGSTDAKQSESDLTNNDSLLVKKDSVPRYVRQLISAYPDFISELRNNKLIFSDGTSMLWDDKKEKNAEQLLDNPDLEDQFAYKYPRETVNQPEYMQDPGRIRYEPLLLKMYGNNKTEVEQNLVKVVWLPNTLNKNLQFSKINGAADSLRAVSAAIDSLPHLHKYVSNPAGTYYWRFISGTKRLSAHSFAIALDINIEYFNYWKWDEQQGKDLDYRNKVSQELVEIFERHGFIWGGKWYHYDTGHFEFRPEFFVE